MQELEVVAYVFFGIGALVGAFGVVVMLVRRDTTMQALATGYIAIAISIAALAAVLFMLSRLGTSLPVVAGVVPIAFLAIFSIGALRRGVQEFRRARDQRG